MNEVHILTCQVYPVSEMSFRCSFALKNMRRVAADSSTARMLTTLITWVAEFCFCHFLLQHHCMCAVAFERIGRQSMEHGVEKEEQRELKL
ncbi:hypothetical protein Y032_0879g2829 [Ancylostoma ceylanicum]|uniref:Uncharacterized protein n=1 Tax=Ancylostoma ceylanicum TaxID=53326 RepID=A0A016W9V2_9BILA|nr:hypothetical protein Y032_0879g2829 [Ancylostoma ceylanicum]